VQVYVNPFELQTPLFEHGCKAIHGSVDVSHLVPVKPLAQQHCWFQQLPPLKQPPLEGHPRSIFGLTKRILQYGKFL
jgi:hypothetical protein